MEFKSGCAAFITGGASGIGLGVARALAAAGVKLILADIDQGAVSKAAETLTETGVEVLPLTLDVRDEAGWRKAAQTAWTWSGGVQLLCNCAGVVFIGGLVEQSVELWRLTQDVNVNGPYFGVRTFLPRMLESGDEGRIVNVASLAGLWGENRLAAYTASKFALVGLSEALQLELARTRIGVTVVFPGQTRTNLGRSTRRLGEREGVLEPVAPGPASEPRGMDPDAVGRRIVEGVQADMFYVITHPDWRPLLEVRHQALAEAFREPAEAGYADSAVSVEKLASRLRAAVGASLPQSGDNAITHRRDKAILAEDKT
jgi:NAD(P)-dependent dehydrogenase (short-subunit alcohol dehydrogenase family)